MYQVFFLGLKNDEEKGINRGVLMVKSGYL